MWWRKTRLVRLYEELEILAILERLIHDSHANSDRDNDIHIFREKRLCEVLAEIAKLEGDKPKFEISGWVALLCSR